MSMDCCVGGGSEEDAVGSTVGSIGGRVTGGGGVGAAVGGGFVKRMQPSGK